MTRKQPSSSDPNDEQRFLTDRQLANRWGISPKTLRNGRVYGRNLPFVRLGRLVRYRLSDVVAWERQHTVSSTANHGGC